MGPLGDETLKLIDYLIKVCPSSLEAKSDHGYTPLFLACLLGRGRFVKTLIDAGADQSVKDKEFNNIVHASLTNSPKLDKLRDLLNLLDPEFRSHLFTQRNHLTHGGDTPLHFWLKSANPIPYENNHYFHHHAPVAKENKHNVKILELLLELSGGQDLDILNGSGETCLHSAVIRQLPEHMKVMLSLNPKLLYRENSVGRTPAEIAYDRFISLKLSRPRDINIGQQNCTNLIHARPETFLAKSSSSGSTGERSLKELVWEVAQEYLIQFPGKRRLVSLNEANDVARRLGENYSWQRYYSKTTASEEVGNTEEQQDKPEPIESDFVTVQYSQKRGLAWQDEDPSRWLATK
jgi:hypothetical protein